LLSLGVGASNGRGPRCSGWFADFIAEKGGDSSIRALTLEGGIKGWVNAGGKFIETMDAFEPEYWKQVAKDAATC
jgi:arsenical-resistance protein 2